MVGSLLVVPLAPAAGTEDPPDQGVSQQADATPLRVTLDSLTPSTLPRRGDVTVSGTVTNRSDSTWTDLNVYLFVSESPMTTSEELEAATATEATLDVGARLTDAGLYDQVSDLAPGESTSYLLSLPRDAIPADEEGVYWIGVHVLGSNEDGRVDGADGRARTFIPLIRGREPRASLSLVVPIKGPVRRDRDGTLANSQAWERMLGEDGRLNRLLELGGTTGDLPLTWLLDPAVLEAATSVTSGDPPFDTSPTDDDSEASPAPEDPTDGASPDASPDDDASDPDDEGEVAQLAAASWLQLMSEQAEDHEVLHVPYGDPDTAAVLRWGAEDLYERAGELATETLESFGLRSTPVVAPVDGRLPRTVLPHLDPEHPVLLSSGAVDADETVLELDRGHRVVATSPVALVGGPSPTPPFTALALRQRILAEAAVHALADRSGRPLVVTTPERWNPGRSWRSAGFFVGLDVPWLQTVSLPFAVAASASTPYDGRLRYAQVYRRRELPARNVRVTRDLTESGGVLAALLNRNDTIDQQVARAALLTSSRNARRAPRRAVQDARGISDQVHDQLRQVTVESSQLVTMSSETGNFSVTVVNGLEEPVTVGLDVETGSDELDIRSPDLVSLGPGQRASVRLAVTATDTGVHSVSIAPTTRDGRALGGETTIKVRSSQVGLVIWFIMGTGAAVFVVAIALRILRRVRARKKTHGPVLKDTTA